VQNCIRPSWCHWHSLSLASVKSRLFLAFCYRLTWVVPEKRPLNGGVNGVVLIWHMLTATTTLRSFNGLFPRTAWLSQYQKGKTSLDLNEARDDGGFLGCSGMSWTICKQSAPCSIQITTPTPYLSHSFTDMLSCWKIAGNKIGRIQLYLQLQNSGVFAWSGFCSFYSVCNPWLLRWVTKYQKVQWFGSIVTLIFDYLCV